jgi:hypothetical protein
MHPTHVTRRTAMQTAGSLGAVAAIVGLSPLLQAQPPQDDHDMNPPDRRTDRDCVIAAGMTEAEADCWETIAKAAGQFFDLPEQHPMDAQEMASAIHIVQNKLLSRPTYRKYLELAKAAYDAKRP